MKLFDTEYIIEIYNEGKGEWEDAINCRQILAVGRSSKEDSITTLQLLRECNPDQSYRLCELTISVKEIDV